jgi:curved DNA-binding protein CbpA
MPIAATDKWEQIALLREGSLAEVPYARLLLALSSVGRTGVLELVRKPVDKRVIFDGGTPVDCRSNLVHETFGRFLVGLGKLTEEQFQLALADSLAREVLLGEVLLDRQLLDAGELYKLLQQCLARKLLDGFTWREGKFRLNDDAATVDTTLKVKVPQLVLTGVLKLTPLEEVTRGLRPLFTEALAVQDSPFSEDELQLRGASAEVVTALQEKPLRMDELAHKLPQVSANELGRVVYALATLDLVGPASRVAPRRTRPAPAPAAGAGAAPVAPPRRAVDESTATGSFETVPAVSDDDLERSRNRILQAYLSYRRRDAFDLLGVRENATGVEVEEAWLRHAELYAPWPLAGRVQPDLLDKARALFLAGSDAYSELRDNERRAMLMHRRQAALAQKANQPRTSGIHTDLLDPEAQFKKGMELRAAGHQRKALELLDYAADLDAQNPIYRAEAAMCRFEATGDPGRPLGELEEALRADPRCGIASYYLGLVQGKAGLFEDAEESLRRAIRLMAPDRRPIDALRELTATKSKKR